MGQDAGYAGRGGGTRGRRRGTSCSDRETDAAGAFQYNTAGVKRDFQQHATQHM